MLVSYSFKQLLWLGVLVLGLFGPVGESFSAVEITRASITWADRSISSEVGLPHNWDLERREYQGIASYRLTVDTASCQNKPCAILIPRWMHNGEVWLNGEMLYRGGELKDPTSRHFNRPVLAILPKLALDSRADIEIRVFGLRRFHSGLSQVYFGPQEELTPMYRKAYFWNVTGVQLSMAISFSAAFIALVYGLVLMQGTAFILFGIAALSLGVRTYALIIRDIPVDLSLWSAVIFTGYGLFLACVTLAGMHLANYRNKRIERVVWALGISFCLVPVGIFGDPSGKVLPALTAMVTPLAVCSGLWIAWIASRRQAMAAMALGISLALFGAMFIYDASFFLNLRPFDTTFVSHYASIAAFMVGLSVMIRENQAAVKQAQAMADGLEKEVASYTAQLSSRFETMRVLEVKTAQSATQQLERARMIKEMNDSIGAKLLAAKAAILSGRLSPSQLGEPVQTVLDDLRLMIDSLDPDASDLASLLGNYRYRMQRRLAERGLALSWDVINRANVKPSSQAPVTLEPGVLLGLARIVHACVEHAIKYPAYERLELRLEQASENARQTVLELKMHWGLEAYVTAPALPESISAIALQLGARLHCEDQADYRHVCLQVV